MDLKKTKIQGCYLIKPDKNDDIRGSFIKTFHRPAFQKFGLETSFDEEYYSVSKKNVLRGLHFQIPPYDHTKIVYCTHGEIFDVVLDIRIGSRTYGKYESFNINGDNANMVYIPKGLAHGFYVLSECAIVMYKVSTVYFTEYDSGILWSSVSIPWPCKDPILSERDKQFQTLDEFDSPFKSERK